MMSLEPRRSKMIQCRMLQEVKCSGNFCFRFGILGSLGSLKKSHFSGEGESMSLCSLQA